MNNYIYVGKIINTFGIKGELKVSSAFEFKDRVFIKDFNIYIGEEKYINGIEVIKAFGKSKTSYEKFVVAAREGSDCYVEWMRDCIWPFTIAFVIAPSTLLAVLPIGGYFFLNGTLSAVNFITIIISFMTTTKSEHIIQFSCS